MKNLTIIFFAIILIFSGCKTEEEFDGPSLNDLYGSFSVVQGLNISDRNVDFATGETTYFTAQFSKNIDWTLRIKGLSSGAVKEIAGFSNLLDVGNATWNGTITSLPMFRVEDCAVELFFLNEADTLRDTLHVESMRINDGLLLSDFENGLNPGWNTFAQSGANMTFSIQSADIAAQGSKYFDIGGTVNWDWLIGYLYMPASAYGSPTFNLSSNGQNEYFNVMLYKPTELNNGIMLFQFREDDNGDGAYSSSTEDMFSIEIPLNQNGWNQYTVRYSDLATLINGAPAAAIGNGVHEPHKLFQVATLFLANPASGYAHAYIDYMIFTHNGPLVP